MKTVKQRCVCVRVRAQTSLRAQGRAKLIFIRTLMLWILQSQHGSSQVHGAQRCYLLQSHEKPALNRKAD